jgi:serine/threonine protein kinase
MALETETGMDTVPMTGAEEAAAGQEFGPYKTIRVLGNGGMGTVYLAEQQQPIRRLVALKVIKLGMDTREVIARFESERQALALMDHPNIARVFDAGTSENGRPYFVMEYVPGIPITEYCDQNLLNNSQRMELFIPVCHAVQHAHQKGVIHRDIKPSNVLVSVLDGKAVPKVIDFGVAKATNQSLTERTFFTEHGLLIGTPEYMSPEQVGGEHVDTTTDIYSLGALLYELLVGVLPFDPIMLRRAGYDGMKRIICEEATPLLTARLRSLGAKTAAISAHRRADPQALERQLRGDLDWITCRAMEKERTRRYASASELAADIERHLRDEPVLASPPGAAYRASQFVRKHRSALAGVLAAFLCLEVVISFVTVMEFRNTLERQFEVTLRTASFVSIAVSTLVQQTVDRVRNMSLREGLRQSEITSELVNIRAAWPSLQEIAVCDRKNEILLDSDPTRLGQKLDLYPELASLVAKTNWLQKFKILLNNSRNYQIEQPLGSPSGEALLYVRIVVAPALMRHEIRPYLLQNVIAALFRDVFAWLMFLLLLISWLWLRR